ncbi:glycosyltransferase [Neptunicella marina]|uniref:Glycosyltransferase n=1 Tax=Neptunicella marina TaxID=2125989 RepID=A0A8J6M432_9ALTE|nr:glycosyltransferase [Neptunicella marina]MBC3767647.1 glycosyltransferase [Neptunicella marina]
MKSIVIVIHDLRGGGAEKMMVRLANQLAAGGDAVTLLLLAQGGSNKAYLSPAVKLVELGCDRTLRAFMPLRRYLQQHQPDAILSALTHVNVISALCCFSLGISSRLSVSERNTFSLDKNNNRSVVMRLTYALAPWLYRWLPNPVIAVSRGVADDLITSTVVRPQDVITAPNPVINEETQQAACQPARHRWLVERPGKVIVAVGRLSAQKGFDLLLQAFSQLDNDCYLIIFGEGELRSALQQQISQAGLDARVELAGYCDNPIAEIQQADLFVLSSRFEGSPNGLVEAMSVGTPVVAFDCPHGPKEIMQNGQGTLVEYLNVNALAHAMADSLQRSHCSTLRQQIINSVQGFQASVAAAVYRKNMLVPSKHEESLCK